MKLFFIICVFNANAFIDNKIAVSNLDTLIFYKNKYTKHRGENAIPQLNYIQHKKNVKYNVSIIECNVINRLNNTLSGIMWSCKSDISKYCDLHNYNIVCDEYNNESISYIIENSCRINYKLKCNKLKTKNRGIDAFLTVCSMLFIISILHSEINKLTIFTTITYLIMTCFISGLFNAHSYSLFIFSCIIYIGKIFNRVYL